MEIEDIHGNNKLWKKNTNINSVKKPKHKNRKRVRNDPEKMDQMINDLMPIDLDNVTVEMKDKIPPNEEAKKATETVMEVYYK